MSEKMRAFLSIDIEDESLLARVRYIQSRLDQEAARLKMVETDSIHFTLRFFGDISTVVSERMHDRLGELRFAPFDITVSGVGAFPSNRRPNVIWVGVSRNHELVKNLKRTIDETLASEGYSIESKFVPHATIARVKAVKNRDRVVANLEHVSKEEVGTMVVSNFRLTRSVLTPSRPVYSTVWEVPATR
jgi:RNA 2',3'-cyclic 3'-phosphodiesterase